MELSKLKKRLVTAKRGHKLLKDKQDELMRRFIDLVKHNNELRKSVEKELSGAFKDFVMARALMSSEFLEEAIMYPKENISVDIQDRKSTRLNSSHANISYAVFCLKKKKELNLLLNH